MDNDLITLSKDIKELETYFDIEAYDYDYDLLTHKKTFTPFKAFPCSDFEDYNLPPAYK